MLPGIWKEIDIAQGIKQKKIRSIQKTQKLEHPKVCAYKLGHNDKAGSLKSIFSAWKYPLNEPPHSTTLRGVLQLREREKKHVY
jgi:hypothetical protein